MSGKDEKRRRREEKQQAARKREALRRGLFWTALVILVPLVLYVFYDGLFGGAPVYPPAEVAANDHVLGNREAPVTLTVYADFQCPACASEARLVASAWPRIQNQARLVFRHFPLDTHRHAFLAARYAEAAGRQDAFWPMHDRLFASQADWALLPDVRQVFDSYALELTLDIDRLHADLDAADLRAKILADQQGGVRAGVRGTPSFFVNGSLVPTPRSATELIDLVTRAAAR